MVTHAEYLICSQCRVVPNCSFSPANRRRTHSLMVSTVSSAIIVWTYIGSPAWKMRERKSRAGAKITTMSGRTARQGRHHLWCSPGRRPDMLGFPTFSHARTKGTVTIIYNGVRGLSAEVFHFDWPRASGAMSVGPCDAGQCCADEETYIGPAQLQGDSNERFG